MAFTINDAEKLPLGLRAGQFLVSIIAFFCVTAVTGLHAADFAFITAFILAAHAALYGLLVIVLKRIEFSPFETIVTDGVLFLLQVIAAIVLAASNTFDVCKFLGVGCGGAYVAVIGLFLGAIIQAVLLYLTYSKHFTVVSAHVVVEDLEAPVVATPAAEYHAPVAEYVAPASEYKAPESH
ncbi:hypothetical protein ACHHYP_09520 [Achlya hypogyna]|uniref:MARVEL domain-containing protein n=1 Tax=Achlya hypogyna TaxID=1202772 RepID=A0A1V9YN56_ACHHY|nr:hypothetical protein ACHHYP_09520 [Achlya hypogyna]